MTDPDQAARLAAIRARRGQAPAEMPVTAAPPAPVVTAPAVATARPAGPSRGQQRVAAGARILATGLTASGVFGLTTAIAAANQPKQVVYTQAPVATTPVVDPAALTGTTLAPVVTVPGAVPGAVVENVVLTIPPVGGAAAPAAAPAATAAPTAGGGQAAAPSPAPSPAAAPAPTPAPTPPPTTAAPVTAPPPPPCTTTASGKCK